MNAHPPFHSVQAVVPIRPHRLLLELEAGEYRIRDLRDLVVQREPLLAPLCGWEFFRRVRVDGDGVTVVWPNGLDLDPGVLYAASLPVDVDVLLAGAGRDHSAERTWPSPRALGTDFRRMASTALANCIGGPPH